MKIEFKKHFLAYLITFLISIVIGLIIFLIYFFVYDAMMIAAINGSSISAFVLLCVGGLVFVSYEGFFDIFSFGFKQLGSSMFGKKGNETKDFAGYKEQNREKREVQPKIFISILIAGLVYLLLMIILRIIGV